MIRKIRDIWNLEKIIDDKIKKYKLSGNFYTKEKEEFIFKLKDLELIISEKYIILNKIKYTSPSQLEIIEKYFLFKKSVYVNSVLLKEKEEFIKNVIKEWKDKKTTFADMEASHILVTLQDEIKEKYLQNISFILEKISPLKIIKDKYIFSIGKSLNLEERKLFNFLKNDEYKLFLLEEKYNKYILADIVNFFSMNKLKYSNFKDLTLIYNFSEEDKKYYKLLIEFFEKDNNNINKIIKKIKDENLEFFNKILLQRTFYNNSKELLDIKERENMSGNLNVKFLRDGNEYYYYNFYGAEGDDLEYLQNLEEEEQIKVIFDQDKDKELDFNKIIKSLEDKELFEELLKEITYKKLLKNKRFKEKKDLTFPKITYADITEELILGHMRIKKDYLQDSGIWAFQGQRWIELRFESTLTELKEKENISLDYNFKLVHYKNTEKEDILDISKELITNWEEKESETKDLVIQFPIDTNYLGKNYLNENSYVTMEFYFELIIEENDIEQKFVLGIPIKIKLLNPEYKDYASNEAATIDFGTSSTCIAINKGSAKKELLSLEEPEEIGELAYENPTNLLIKDWQKFYEIWNQRDIKKPIIRRYENIYDKEGLYNQGHGLKEELRQHPDKAELNAEINQLKLVPYKLLTLKEEVKLYPYFIPQVGIKEIDLVSEYENQNEVKFDIISFYGYLLGRAVFSPLNEKIIKEFYVTVPVKFEDNVKDSILNSIKNGIKLAVPEPIKDKIVVKEGHEEPVAFMGAICGNKTLVNTNWGVNSKFAVFDFGGGTIDFAFGKYRDSNEDSEEEWDYDRIIDVLNTAGDEKGGAEYIIHKLSYYIYRANAEIMKEKRIPFVIPEGENEIELFPKDLQTGKTKTAITNVNKINEDISRKIFENKDDELQTTLELQNETGNFGQIELTIERNLLETYLRELLAKQVQNFKKLLFESFKNEENVYGNLHIFRAGNASRSEILNEILNEEFRELLEKDNEAIHFIEEDSVHGIRPKTAVALGELNLQNSDSIGVIFSNKLEKNEIPFEFNVGCPNIDNDSEFLEIISIGSITKEWKKLGRANRQKNEFIIYYTKNLGMEEINNSNIKIFNVTITKEELENGNIVWIRPKVANKLEYIIARKQPDIEEEGTVIELPRY